ncbi:hypothetical protein Tco_0701167 [Tanacetum coccineum]
MSPPTFTLEPRSKTSRPSERKSCREDQEVPSQTDQDNAFATPEEQISPSTLEAAQILTNVASEGFKGSQALCSVNTAVKVNTAELLILVRQKEFKEKRKRSNDLRNLQAKSDSCRKIQPRRKEHGELKSKSFEEIQVLYERYKKQDQTFVAIGSEEDERAIKKMNEKDIDKEKEQKADSVHEEVKEDEGAKKGS